MPRIKYKEIKFRQSTLDIIALCNRIIVDYAQQGFDLTLRQLFYQLVSKALIPNSQKEYDKLGAIVNDARLAGLMDWDAIVDRTRNLEKQPSWASPAEIVKVCAQQFKLDMWKDQDRRVEVWIEKDALKGVIAGVCDRNDVPYFSCRGYTSQSEMWSAAQRLLKYHRAGQKPIILHLGDHDPSGKDMTRDITDRLQMFMGGVEVERLALNYDQIEEFSPPENPAKLSDSRATAYVQEFGYSSWELDALSPTVIAGLIQTAIDDNRDADKWEAMEEQNQQHRDNLQSVSDNWDDVAAQYGSEVE